MTDLVKRLRTIDFFSRPLQSEAADRLEQLEANQRTETHSQLHVAITERNKRIKELEAEVARLNPHCFKALHYENAKLHDALDEALGLIRVATCPQCDGSGAVPDAYGDYYQCQWCAESQAVLEKYGSENTSDV